MKRIVILASGRGTNFEVIAKRVKEGYIPAYLSSLIVDKECGAINRALKYNISVIKLKDNWKEHLLYYLNENMPDLIVLAGFMRILPEHIVSRFFPKIINIHPSLLPSFKGVNAIKQAYEYGVKVTGITIHVVDEGVDTGPIIFQRALEIKPYWSLSRLESMIHRIEHIWYPRIIKRLLTEKWYVKGRKVVFE